jgi:hypothetical protein
MVLATSSYFFQYTQRKLIFRKRASDIEERERLLAKNHSTVNTFAACVSPCSQSWQFLDKF